MRAGLSYIGTKGVQASKQNSTAKIANLRSMNLFRIMESFVCIFKALF